MPGAHFAGLQAEKVIVVCDRYSAYKNLARLAENILLPFCWAHVRRDFLDAGRAFSPTSATHPTISLISEFVDRQVFDQQTRC